MKALSPRFAAVLALLSLIATPVSAQISPAVTATSPAADPLPWLYKNSDVPVDKSWSFGTLDNGLRYAIKRNGVPPGQVSVRLRIDAGSLMETDSERGLAHFMEHLTFRGSTYVPDGEAKRIWQRLGATFGSDSNAETTPTQTVYKLDLPDANRGSLGESLKILSGMMQAPGLTQAAIDAERPVVLAELREQAGPQTRVINATRKLFFAGQRLADRSPIGTPETLLGATPASVKGFHDRWYRPENTVLVIAGDADPAMMEELLREHFGNWKGIGKAGTAPDFGDPVATAPIAETVTGATLPRYVTLATIRPWRQVNDTIVYNQGILTDLLALQLINRRLEAHARNGASYLQAGVNQEDISRSIDGTFTSIVPLTEDWEAAVRDVRAVIADALATAPSPEELQREITEFDVALAIGVEGYRTEAARKQADDIVNAVDIRETVATPQVALDVFRGIKDSITPEKMLESTRRQFAGVATRAVLTAPEAAPDATERLAKALTDPVKPATDSRIAQSSLTFDALPNLGRRGKIRKQENIAELGVERLELRNKIRVLLFPNDAEQGKVSVTVRFGHGLGALPADVPSLAWTGPLALTASGVGDLGQEALDRITTGRRIGLDFSVDDDAYEFSADTRPADLADQLKLIAAKLEHPRWDAAPVLRARAAALIGYDGYLASPDGVLGRDAKWLLYGKDARWKTPAPEELDALTPEAFRAFWEPIMKAGPVEVLIFGDFKREEAVKAVLDTFGALKTRRFKPDFQPIAPNRFPVANVGPTILTHRGDAERAAALIAWPTGGGLAQVRESRQLEVLSALFSDRLFEILRSKEGATYSPQVINNWPLDLPRGGNLTAVSQMVPDDIDRFYRIVKSIADDMKANPVPDDELKRVTEPLRQQIARASSGNGFWLSQMKGATFNPQKFIALRSLLSDYTNVTSAEIQALAQKYLRDDAAYKLVVLPEGK